MMNNTQGVVYSKYDGFAICGTNDSSVDNNAGLNITSSEIYIQNYFEDLPVKQIGKAAFRKNEIITKIHIPMNVEYMFYDAVAYCSNLEKVFFEEGSHLIYIYSGSIYYLNKLKYLHLPRTISLVPANLSLGANYNFETLIYCGSAIFPSGTFMRANIANSIYCPKTIYVMQDYPSDNFGGCYNIKRLIQCDIMPPIPCNTVRNNNYGCNNLITFSYFSVFIFL